MAGLFVDFFKANADKRFKFEEPVYDRRAWYWPPVPTAYRKKDAWTVKDERVWSGDERERCPDCGAYLDFYGDCDRCGYIGKVQQEPMVQMVLLATLDHKVQQETRDLKGQ
jgi:hypothetical protein